MLMLMLIDSVHSISVPLVEQILESFSHQVPLIIVKLRYDHFVLPDENMFHHLHYFYLIPLHIHVKLEYLLIQWVYYVRQYT